jgi:hypothetical protein
VFRYPAGGITSKTSRPALGPHPASYSVSNKALPPGVVRRPGREADHLPALVSRLRMSGTILDLPHTPPWIAKGQVYLLLLSLL